MHSPRDPENRIDARESDTEIGLYYYRARYYDPNVGRFLSEDPNDQGSLYDNPNLYDYVENNPANWIDLLGLQTSKDTASSAFAGDRQAPEVHRVEDGSRSRRDLDFRRYSCASSW